ncbi:MAG: hypothetical protein KBF27_10310 [Cypionkella sp.]|nr:hypothetical protein [Cypionkella sp.]
MSGSRYEQLKAARRSKEWLARAEAEINGLISDLETDVKGGVQGGIKAPPKPADVLAEHRRAHRMGRPAKIAVDSERQAFVAARFDTLTFEQIAREVADNFPPERRVSLSAIHRWWQKARAV